MADRFFLTPYQSLWKRGNGARFALTQQVGGIGWANGPRIYALIDVSWVKGSGYDCGFMRGSNANGRGKPWCLCLVTVPDVESALLNTISLDAQTVDLRFGRDALDMLVSDLPQAVREAAANFLEARGVPMDWITPSTTVREVIQFIVRLLKAVQSLDADYPEVDLDQTFSTIPAAQRNRIRNWAVARGLPVGAISNSTPIRTIVRRVGQWVLGSEFRGIKV